MSLIVSTQVVAQAPVGKSFTKPQSVTIVEVKSTLFEDHIEALGTLLANEFVYITTNVSETVQAIYFEEGEKVRHGDLLVELDSDEEQALLNEAQSQVTEAKLQFERIQRLVKAGTGSESELDERRRNFNSAKARLAAMHSRLNDRTLYAPFSGTLGLRQISVGALVKPGDVITSLSDDRTMRLEFSVPSKLLPLVKKGANIRARTNIYPDRHFEGTVFSLDNQIDPDTRSILVRAKLTNEKELLKQGMLMAVQLFYNPRQTLVIPEEAIVSEGERNYVWRVDSDQEGLVASKQNVVIGSRVQGEVEILDGLQAGQKIVAHGGFKLRPGARVSVWKDALKNQGEVEK